MVTDIYSVTATGLCNRCSVTVPNAQPRNAVPERSERLPKPGTASLGARSFFKHHTQQLAAAAQVGDAKGIRRKITQMKIRLMKDVLKAGGRA